MMESTATSAQLYFRPETVEQAIELALAHQDSFKFIAGGTDVMVNRFLATEKPSCLIDLGSITALKNVEKEKGFLRIGSGVILDGLRQHSTIRDEFPVLLEAAQSVGSPLIRKSATLGGNILCENRCQFYNQSEFWRTAVGFCLKCDGEFCIATGGTKACFSKFASDTAPALISMGAQVEVLGPQGKDTIPMENIFSGDGINPITLDKTAIIQHILLPLDRGFRSVFRKLRSRESVDFTSLTSAVTIDKAGHLKIALGGIDPKPVVMEADSHFDPDEMIKGCTKKARAVDNDVMFSRKYRKSMIEVFLRDSFEKLQLSKTTAS